jgi:ubiquitin-protein ligase
VSKHSWEGNISCQFKSCFFKKKIFLNNFIFVMASYPNKSMNRIHHDLCEYKKERENDQLKGIILFMPEESNIYEIHSSIEILDGIYKGIILHTILKLPQNYPNEGPSMSFPSDFDFPRN